MILTSLALLIAFFIGGLGILGIAAPGMLVTVSSFALTQKGIYAAAVFRLVAGAILIGAASTARMPRTIRTVGLVILIAGLSTPFLGVERAKGMVDWFTSNGTLAVRAAAAIAVALALFIIYAVAPRQRG